MLASPTRNRSPWPAVLIAAVVAVLLWVAAVALGLMGFGALASLSPRIAPARTVDRSGPTGDLKSATVRLSYGATLLSLTSADLGGTLYSARFELSGRPDPSTDLDSARGLLTIRIPGQNRSCFFWCPDNDTRSRLDLTLNNRLPWTISLGGGASHGTLDLRGLSLAGLDVSGGANSTTIQLPAPKGTVPVAFSGGADSVALTAPAGTQARIQISGGASTLVFNGSRSEEFGRSVEQQTDGYAGAQDRYDVTASGGAVRVTWASG